MTTDVTTLDIYAQYADAGVSDVGSTECGIPSFILLQANSPQVDEGLGRGGQFFCTTTSEATAELTILPVARDHEFIEWAPRSTGLGVIKRHSPTSQVVVDARAETPFGKITLPNGNALVETFTLYVIAIGDGGAITPGVIRFASTQIAAYKSIAARAGSMMLKLPDGRTARYPWFAHAWSLKAAKKVKKENSWYVITPSLVGGTPEAARAAVSPDALAAAAQMYDAYRAGGLKVGQDAEAAHNSDEEAPF